MEENEKKEFEYTIFEYNDNVEAKHYLGCRFFSSYTGKIEEKDSPYTIVGHCNTSEEAQQLCSFAKKDSIIAHFEDMAYTLGASMNGNLPCDCECDGDCNCD